MEWFREWHMNVTTHQAIKCTDNDDNFIEREWEFVEDNDTDSWDTPDAEPQQPAPMWFTDDDDAETADSESEVSDYEHEFVTDESDDEDDIDEEDDDVSRYADNADTEDEDDIFDDID